MSHTITFTEIAITEIHYNYSTGLFPFSPRQSVDRTLVERLKVSIQETGLWQPVVVKADTQEGIAGNHRFLAWREAMQEQSIPLDELVVPVALVDCTEEDAILIALAENEFRESLTPWETIQTLIQASMRHPRKAQKLFDIDEGVVAQLRLWEPELDQTRELQERQQARDGRLTREWLTVIQQRLADYPALREQFLERLRHPTWVRANSLDALNASITSALLQHGRQFKAGETWNQIPTPKCLGCHASFEAISKKLLGGDALLQTDGALPEACPHLRLIVQKTTHFLPSVGGKAILPSPNAAHYPPETLCADGVRGDWVDKPAFIESYCVDPLLHQTESCFHQRESEAAQAAVSVITTPAVPVVLLDWVTERSNGDEFVWLNPVREGEPCNPENCLHAKDKPPGFVRVLHKNGQCQMTCIHRECGEAAQQARGDWELRQQRAEEKARQIALNHLRQATVERALFSDAVTMANPEIKMLMETALVPQWDTTTMINVVIGWQQTMLAQSKMGHNTFVEKHDHLAAEVTEANAAELFTLLRETYVLTPEAQDRWLACLTLARQWRDVANSQTKIDEALVKIAEVMPK